MSNSVTDMQLFFMGLHENDQTFSCKNTDQLSSLWAAFTKCKRNIRDGFRLENMSWRLWSRQTMIRKKQLALETAIVLPELTTTTTTAATCQQNLSLSPSSITADNATQATDSITPPSSNEYTAPRLVRTRSLPSLSCQAQHIMDSCHQSSSPSSTSSLSAMDLAQSWTVNNNTTKESSVLAMPSSSSATTMPKQSKFYIHQDDEDDGSVNDSEDSDMDSIYNHEDGDYFDDDMDMSLSCYSSDTTSSSSYPSMDGDIINDIKPASLLTDLLQKDTTPCELRRSNCCERLDLWFSGALS